MLNKKLKLELALEKALKIVAVLITVTVIISSGSALLTASQTIHSYGVIHSLSWLSIDGQWIVNEQGERMAIRGVGCDYVAYYQKGWIEKFIQDTKNRGYNSMRLSFSIPPWETHHKLYDQDEMDRIIDLCEQNGLYVIITAMHWWASEEVQGWEQPLPNHEQDWIDFWVDVADHYKDNSAILGYEIYNEPLGVGNTPDGKNIVDCYIDAVDAIRQVDDKHIIILYEDSHKMYHSLEEKQGLADRVLFDPSTKIDNVIYSSHHWWGEGLTATADYGEANRQAAGYVEGLKYYSDWLGVPVWAGEFGTYDYGDYSNANWEYVREVIRLCEEVGIAWNYWQMEAFEQYAPEALEHITPTPYTTNYYGQDIPRTTVDDFGLENPKPFNIWNKIVSKSGYVGDLLNHRWGSTWMNLPNGALWIELEGPISVRVRVWDGADQYNFPLKSDEIITIPAGETRTISGSTYTEVYAENDFS